MRFCGEAHTSELALLADVVVIPVPLREKKLAPVELGGGSPAPARLDPLEAQLAQLLRWGWVGTPSNLKSYSKRTQPKQ